MRMRKLKHLVERQERCQAIWVTEPESLMGQWRSLMPEAKEVWLEIGCGKGKFTAETAQANPEMLLLGMERVAEAHVMAMEKAMEMELQNVRYIIMDAEWLDKSFAPGELDGIFLNFSDPWPSTRHAHRRLTHRNFLARYARALKPGGKLCFKTDNAGLFEFSVKEFERNGWKLSEVTRDLHRDGIVGIMTGYEEKFHAQGIPICRLEAVYEGAAHDSHSDC